MINKISLVGRKAFCRKAFF